MLKKTILFAMIFSAATGCKKVTEDGDLRVSISKTAVVLPLAIQSCEDEANGDATVKSLAANSAKFNNLILKWYGGSNVNVAAAKAKFTSSALQGGKFEASFEITNLSINGGDTADKPVSCAIRLGGIKFANATRPVTIPGTLTVTGIVTSSDGEVSVVYADTDIELAYDPH